MTAEEKRKRFRELLKQGYTMAVVLPDDTLCPGYHDWALEWELDMRDLRVQPEGLNVLHSHAAVPQAPARDSLQASQQL